MCWGRLPLQTPSLWPLSAPIFFLSFFVGPLQSIYSPEESKRPFPEMMLFWLCIGICSPRLELQEQEQMLSAPISGSLKLSLPPFFSYLIPLQGYYSKPNYPVNLKTQKTICWFVWTNLQRRRTLWLVKQRKGGRSLKGLSVSRSSYSLFEFSLCSWSTPGNALTKSTTSNLLNGKFLSLEWNWIYEKDLFASMCVTEESGVFHCQTRTRWPSLFQPWFRAKLR